MHVTKVCVINSSIEVKNKVSNFYVTHVVEVVVVVAAVAKKLFFVSIYASITTLVCIKYIKACVHSQKNLANYVEFEYICIYLVLL